MLCALQGLSPDMSPDPIIKETPIDLLKSIGIQQIVSTVRPKDVTASLAHTPLRSGLALLMWADACHVPLLHPQVVFCTFSSMIGLMIATFYVVLNAGGVRLAGLD